MFCVLNFYAKSFKYFSINTQNLLKQNRMISKFKQVKSWDLKFLLEYLEPIS